MVGIGIRPQFVLFGDSITEQSLRAGGWGAALADTYSRKVLPLLLPFFPSLIFFLYFNLVKD